MQPQPHFPGPRGALADHLAVRLADEGIPVAAIARVTRRPSNELYPILKSALEGGHLTQLPKHDWAPGTSRDTRSPTLDHKWAERQADIMAMPVQITFRLTMGEAAVLTYLLARGQATKGQLHQATCAVGFEPESLIKIVDVFVCKLRRKLAPHGFTIETIWGRGYRITNAMRDAILEHVREANA